MSAVIRAAVREHLTRRLRAKIDPADFGYSDSLFISGRLDSLDAMETVIFLENAFNVDFSKIGFDQALIDSVDAIDSLVEDALQAR